MTKDEMIEKLEDALNEAIEIILMNFTTFDEYNRFPKVNEQAKERIKRFLMGYEQGGSKQ